MLPIPPLLTEMIADGRWPGDAEMERAQNSCPLIGEQTIRAIAPEESWLYLFAPPFQTVSERSQTNLFWFNPNSMPGDIDFDLAVDIGDFGLGSDAPILLDYRLNQFNPRVIRLRWSTDRAPNQWVVIAKDFPTFVEMLGLSSAPRRRVSLLRQSLHLKRPEVRNQYDRHYPQEQVQRSAGA